MGHITFGRCCCAGVSLVCTALSSFAQMDQVDRAQLFRANAPSVPVVPGAPSGEESGYAAHSENDEDLGTQRILKKFEEYKPWTAQFGLPIYYTSNVGLVRRGEQDDVVFAPSIAVTYEPRLTKTLFGEFSLQQQFFEYARFGALNFAAFDGIAGLVYYMPQLHNFSLRARYDFS